MLGYITFCRFLLRAPLLHIASRHGERKSFAIGVDNQATLKAFHSDLRSSAHHLAREVRRITNRALKKRGNTNHKLTLRWTAGHEGIPGNELADAEAKKAASGLTSDKHSLPAYLRKTLPRNPAALK